MHPKLQALLAGLLSYLFIARTQILQAYLSEFLMPPQSTALSTSGIVYGICSPIEDLQRLNSAIFPIL